MRTDRAASPPFQQSAPIGIHEVIVETPAHERRMADYDAGELAAVLEVYRSRLVTLSACPGVESVAIFRNEGSLAGASQDHAHSQVVALPLVSGRLANELVAATTYRRERGQCPTCEMLAEELDAGQRVILQNEDFVALASFAPRFPYETWIVPKAHVHDFSHLTPTHLASLASLVSRALSSFHQLLGRFPYNLVLQTAPPRAPHDVSRSFHWRLEILPRLNTASGFELGSGVFIVDVAPETAAMRLRSVLADDCTSRQQSSEECAAGC